jgi:hypothetical protein
LNKKIFAYFLLTIISFQLLPLKEVGAIFYGNQMIEEICNTGADADGKNAENSEDLKKSDMFLQSFSDSLSLNTSKSATSYAIQQDYHSRPADDIPTPPPLSFFQVLA